MKFNLTVTLSSASRTSATLNINGVTFKTGADQSLAGAANAAVAVSNTRAGNATAAFTITHTTATTDFYSASGDVELDSKPTWAY